MEAARIQYLAQFIPDNSDYFRFSLGQSPSETSKQQRQIDRFLTAYRDLAFGFHFVRALIKEDQPLPPDVYEQELIDLYWFELDGNPNQQLVEALSLRHPTSRFLENSVQAMLLTGEPLQEISKVAGISPAVLQYYEQLFFNVRDRRNESLFIASIVYPEHRLVETMENYIKDVDAGSFLKRSAFNNGLDDVSYFVGLKVPSIESGFSASAQEMASRLESSIMANGHYLARNGFLNQRSSHGVGAARGLIVAAKQGGEDTSDLDTFGAGNLGDALVNELTRVKGGEMQNRIRQQQLLIEREQQAAKSKDPDSQTDEEALAEE
jgi:hypothetical protein